MSPGHRWRNPLPNRFSTILRTHLNGRKNRTPYPGGHRRPHVRRSRPRTFPSTQDRTMPPVTVPPAICRGPTTRTSASCRCRRPGTSTRHPGAAESRRAGGPPDVASTSEAFSAPSVPAMWTPSPRRPRPDPTRRADRRLGSRPGRSFASGRQKRCRPPVLRGGRHRVVSVRTRPGRTGSAWRSRPAAPGWCLRRSG